MDILKNIRIWSQVASARPAYISSGKVLTYAELENRSNALAAHLRDSAPGNHAPVAVIGHKEPDMLVAFLGAVKSGHAYIPIDISTPKSRVDAILGKAQPALVLTPAEIASILQSAQDTTPISEQALDNEAPWYIIFTSGSTGEPKGVIITTGCLSSFVDWMLAEQQLHDKQEIFINQAPFSFDLSVMDLYLSLATGGTLYGITAEEIGEPRQLFLSLAACNASVWVSTPSFAQMCLHEPTFKAKMMPELRKFLFCGETLPPNVAASLLERFPDGEVWNTYGPTEATCATTSIRITHEIIAEYNPLPVGFPKPDCNIRVLNSDGTPATLDGTRGEILIAGPNVSTGYLGQPETTARVFSQVGGQRAYRTGDLGHFENNLLFFDGRLDNQIKLHGYRIELGDIEANLMALALVADAVVIPHFKDNQPDYLAACIISKDMTSRTDSERTRAIKRELRLRVPAYMIPHKCYFFEHFPMTTNGKADRRKLAEMIQ